MPPKVDPSEVRFSNFAYIQSTLKFSEVRLGLLPLLLPSWVHLVLYISSHLECQEGW